MYLPHILYHEKSTVIMIFIITILLRNDSIWSCSILMQDRFFKVTVQSSMIFTVILHCSDQRKHAVKPYYSREATRKRHFKDIILHQSVTTVTPHTTYYTISNKISYLYQQPLSLIKAGMCFSFVMTWRHTHTRGFRGST